MASSSSSAPPPGTFEAMETGLYPHKDLIKLMEQMNDNTKSGADLEDLAKKFVKKQKFWTDSLKAGKLVEEDLGCGELRPISRGNYNILFGGMGWVFVCVGLGGVFVCMVLVLGTHLGRYIFGKN